MDAAQLERTVTDPDQHLVRDVLRAYVSFKRRLGGVLPEGYRAHRRAARRENLLALRALIDGAIERLEREERDPGS